MLHFAGNQHRVSPIWLRRVVVVVLCNCGIVNCARRGLVIVGEWMRTIGWWRKLDLCRGSTSASVVITAGYTAMAAEAVLMVPSELLWTAVTLFGLGWSTLFGPVWSKESNNLAVAFLVDIEAFVDFCKEIV